MEGDVTAVKQPVVFVQTISQKDNHTFTLIWSDGTIYDYRLSELQKRCPCANCYDETTGKRLLNESAIRPDTRAVRITSVGRYALRVQFTAGCSAGIYCFDMLYEMAKGRR